MGAGGGDGPGPPQAMASVTAATTTACNLDMGTSLSQEIIAQAPAQSCSEPPNR